MNRQVTSARRIAAALAVVSLGLAACTGDDDTATVATVAGDRSTDEQPIDELSDSELSNDGGDPEGTFVDLTLTRDDIGCDADALGEDDLIAFDVAHVVVDGVLGGVCYGTDDETVIASWELLATITPPGQLGDLGLFTGFRSGEDGDEVTLAFVNPIDDDGTQFQMSVNLETAEDDTDELLLTLAHEFTHVFTALDTQLDRSDESLDTCTTYDNGDGCYFDDSLMYDWILEFWNDGLIDEVDPEIEATVAEGEDRCDRDPGFFGSYAASNPEEDFAESFSAYVLRLDAHTPEQQDRLDWIDDQPGLSEFRDRAMEAGFGPIDNDLGICGEG